MKTTKLSLAVIALISKADAVKHNGAVTFTISPNLAQILEDPAPAKTEKAAPAKVEKAAPAKADKAAPAKVDTSAGDKVDVAAPSNKTKATAAKLKPEQLTPEGTPIPGDPTNPQAPLDIVPLTKKNVHGFYYNPYGPENPYPQRETHGHINDHYDQRLLQKRSRDWRTPIDVKGLTVNQYDDTIHSTPDGFRTDKEGVPVQWPNWQPGQWIASGARKYKRDDWRTPLSVQGKTVNQLDDTIHTADGVRTDKEGVPVQWPNWQPGQWVSRNSRAQADPQLDTLGKDVNQYDDTVHFKNGTRTFKNGTKLQWPNWQPESLHQDIAFINPTLDVTGKTVNEFDDTIHLENGKKAFRDGTQVQWPNYEPENLAQSYEVPSELGGQAPPAELGGGAKGKVNSWDGLVHNADGTKSFPNGEPVLGVNQWAQKRRSFVQTSEGPAEIMGAPAAKAPAPAQAPPAELQAPPAELGGSAPAAPQGKFNKYDGTYHIDGNRFFPDGAPTLGVNRWAQRLYQDDLNNEAVQDFSNDISMKNQMKISPINRHQFEQPDESEFLDRTDTWNGSDEQENAAYFDGNYWTSRMPEKYQSGSFPSTAPLKWAN